MMAELKKANVKSKVEAILFSVGHKIGLDDISKLCRSRKEDILAALNELRQEYEQKQSSLMLVEEGDSWKFTVRDHLIPVVRKIVTETELTKSVMETLAVVAFKYPILQSDLIKIRTNKAYDHLAELEKSGYITRQKHSRTNLIKLTEKFFRYFDLTEEKLKDQFKDFGSIARAIKEKEEEIERIKEEQRRKAEELKQQDEKIKKEIEELDKDDEEFEVPLEAYESKAEVSQQLNQKPIIQEKDKNQLEGLEVVDIPKEAKNEIVKEEIKEQTMDEIKPLEQTQAESQKSAEQQPQQKIRKQKKKKGIELTPEMEAKVEQKVEEMLHGKESKEEAQQ